MADMDDMIESDVQKTKRAYQEYKRGGSSLTFPQFFESLLWMGAVLAGLGMFALMPWVGQSKPIPGTAWLALGVGGLVVFGALALATRWVRTHSQEIDRGIERSMRK